ncbi:MAG: sodium:solute symporter family protein [Phycisphaerae bacterium]|nr:sodium:solute symporter family protein [Phycisphaerae bacterium]
MLYLVAIFAYLLALTAIGVWKSRSVKNQTDFAVAGRTLSPWILVCTMLAAWIGTGSIVGNAGKTYEVGIAALFIPMGSVIGMMLLTQIAGKARNFEVYSVPEIIGRRYGLATRRIAVLALVIAYMVIVSYQFNALGAVLEAILTDETGKSLLTSQQATIIAAVFIILYTILAGMMSVAFSDILTGIIITITLIVGLPILWFQAGGLPGLEQKFAAIGKPDHMNLLGVFRPVDLINFCLPVFLLIMGDANQYQRFFSSKDAKGAKTAATFMIFAVFLIEGLIIVEAWISSSMIPDAEKGKFVLIYAARQLLPTVLGLFFMITIVGIIISTADSFLLIPATCLIRDIYVASINPKASEKRVLLFSRLTVLVLGIVAYGVALAFSESTTIFEKAMYAYTIYGAAITPCLVAALFWKRATTAGAITSIFAGTATTLVWEELVKVHLREPFKSLDAVLPAITLSLVCLVGVSLLTRPSIRERA